MRFEITPTSILIDRKEQPLLCGELHYFRMPKKYWADALDRLVECGCNAVAYYVPWFVHEYEENKFDFHGSIHEDNDLHSWIRLTQEKGLLGFIRPGPYVYAETKDLGIPGWFSDKCPNAHIQAYRNGKYVPYGFERNAAHNHPDFIKAVSGWYEAVCSEIKDYLAPKGNIILFQLCNEIPNDDIDDRNPENLGIGDKNGILPKFLLKKYHTLDKLNKAYNSDFTYFESIEPHMLEEKNKDLSFNDHLEFYYGSYYPQYFETLMNVARNNGINVQLVHNAYNPRAVSLHYHNKKKNPWLNIGVDCYYSLSGRISMKDVTYFCEFGAEYIKSFLRNVPWVIEHECGYWNDYPAVYGPELYIWNIWTIAAGFRGFNMYLFASGINRPGMGFFGTDHNWQAPINEKGEKQSSFEDIRRSIADIRENSSVFLADNRYDISLGIKNAYGLIWKDVSKISSDAYFALRSSGFTPEICDFEALPLECLKQKEILWVVSDRNMDAEVQQKLCDFVSDGGRLIIQGTVPYKNYSEQPCTLLAEKLGLKIYPHEDRECPQQKILLNGKEYFIGRTIQKFEAPKEFIRAYDGLYGMPAAAEIPLGSGFVLVLPFRVEMSFYSMTECLKYLLEGIGITPGINGSKLLGIIPKANNRSVILNLHPITVKEDLTIFGQHAEVELAPHSFKII
jgi:beta-galactosidase